MGVCGYGCCGISVRVLGTGAGSQEGQGSSSSLSSHSSPDPAGAWSAVRQPWPTSPSSPGCTGRNLKNPWGFTGTIRLTPPPSRAPWRGSRMSSCRGPLTEWVARVVADQELNASVDGKWAKQSKDAQGNPLMMVNVLAHDLKLCLPSGRRRRSGTSRGCCGRSWAGCSRTTPACGC